MGSRRDNRSSGVGPTATLHSKHHHEKRNQELLLKRLASPDTTPSYPMSPSATAGKTPSRGGMAVMSKSLTLEIGKGQYGHDAPSSAGKSRTRKSDIEKSLKSVQRQTSSSKSSLKMSNSLNEKELFVDNKTSKIRDLSPAKGKGQVLNNLQSKTTNRKRDSMTGKTSSSSTSPAGYNGDKKGGLVAGENIKRAGVFERLSRQDCNKGVTRSEHGPSNRIRDRSPTKTGRKSPQEKNVASDKHQRNRKSAPGDATAKSTLLKKRDTSPVKREDNGRRSLSSSQGGSIGRRKIIREKLRGCDHDREEDDKDGSREKLEKDNVPESLDKDLEDLAVNDVVDKKSVDAVPRVLHGKEISIPSHQGRGGGVEGGRGGRGGGGGGKARLEASEKGKLGHHATPPPSSTSPANPHSPKTSTTVAVTSKKSNADKVLHGAKNDGAHTSENLPKTPMRHAKSTLIETTPAELCKADVMQKVRQRVPNDSRRDAKDTVVDDDKDVCDAEKCDEDDFYKIKVQTRLVSYSNSTLVIKNTSKGSGVGDLATASGGGGGEGEGEGQTKDLMSDSSHPLHPPPPTPAQPHTLQSSSVPPAADAPHSCKVDPDGGAPLLLTEAHRQRNVVESEGERVNAMGEDEDDTAPLNRSRSMKLKLSQFVCKGKNFLTDVYSATQSKLEQYTRVEMPSSANTTAAHIGNNQPNSLRATLPNDSDCGYYSISTSLEGIQQLSSMGEHHPVASQGLGEDTCEGDVPVNQEYPKNVSSSSADGRTDTPDSGTKTKTDDMANEEDEVLPDPPAPHANFKLNEDWIKKNILCTCKCKRNVMKMATGQDHASHSIDNKVDDVLSTDALAIEKTNDAEIDSAGLVNEEHVSSASSVEGAATTKDLEDDLCFCSCHEGEDDQQHQQLPKEVLELLDADHARMWWTITGNFGNILPIDWSKTYTRQQYLPVLNLNEAKALSSPSEESERTEEDDAEEEEEVAQDLDLHHLILNGLSAEPVKSAEEVIKEIDDLMQEGSSSEDEGVEEASSSSGNANEPVTQPLPPPLYAEKLNNMSIGELNESFNELELVIRQYSETLINQLALRDELEYEKELKNSFISLLLQVQNKRRNFNVEKKKQKKVGPNGIDPKYLTTVIPYDVGHGPPQNETLQILIKILMAINEDSPTVPTLLTDYILKVLCPS